MVKSRKVELDVSTGKETITEIDVENTPSLPEQLVSIDLKELKALVAYAKKQGWIS